MLVWLLVIPLIGALVGAFMRGEKAPKVWALLVSLATVAVGAGLLATFDFAQSGYQFVTRSTLFASADVGVSFSVGIDSVSLGDRVRAVPARPARG